MKQPDEELEDLMGRDDAPNIWLWIATILAAFAIVGLVTLYASHLPLGDYEKRSMTER